MAIGKEGNVKWVDGLRGLASTLVVMTHIARAFDVNLFEPTPGEGLPPRILQLPFIRILFQGRIGVTIFSFVTGYVCALKPIRLYGQGNQEAAFDAIAKSALRRVPRLVIPAALATLICWAVAELGGFMVAKRCDSFWAGVTGPDYIPWVGDALNSLIYNIVTTWTRGINLYDGNQWTMLPLLKGSMLVYTFIVATAYVEPRYRMMGSVAMWMYYYFCSDSAFGMQFFWGVFLCDLQNHAPASEFIVGRPRLSRFLSIVLILTGLYVASYPEGHHEWAVWSRWQFEVLVRILPQDPDFPRFSSGLGLELITLGIHFSPFVRDILSTRPLLWLGRQSFAVYLLHGPLLRTILCWMIYGIHLPPDVTNDKGETFPGVLHYPGHMHLFFWLPFWIPMVYGAAVLWTTFVDPWCAQITEKIVKYVKIDLNEKGIMLPH